MSEDILEKAVAAGTVLSPLTSPGAMTTSGATGDTGGVLLPEQSRQFIDYMFDQMVLAQDGRRVTMRGNTMEMDKIKVGTRLVTKATQADQTGANKAAQFTKLEISTTKFRLDYELSTESLEDNIEGAALEDHVVRLMASQFGNDLEDIAINGAADTTAGYYPTTLDGFIKKIKDTDATGHEAAAAVANVDAVWDVTTAGVTAGKNTLTLKVLEDLYNAMPRKFKVNRSALKYYVGSKHLTELIADLRKLGTVPEEVAVRVIDGQVPRLGGNAGAQYRVFGVPVLEVPLYPDNYIDITAPTNRVWGFQRDVTVHREFKPKKDTVEYTVYTRFGVQVEEKSAIAWAKPKTA
jgi:hypothetical protein